MGDARFDTLRRKLTADRSRRGALAALLGGTTGVLGLAGATAKNRKKQKKKRCPTQPAPASPGPCPCVPACAGKVCGDDGCGGICGIACSGPRICEGGRCVCPSDQHDCQGTCIPRTQCCTAADCLPDQGCVSGTCITLLGTCAVGANTCASFGTVCDARGQCACFTTRKGATRCGNLASLPATCNNCTNDAECAARFPSNPGAFCAQGGGSFCVCPSFCVTPCPS
jgi:hypothetical protein